MQRHSGKMIGLAVAVVVLAPILSGAIYLAPHGTRRGYYEVHFEPSEPWGFGAKPNQVTWHNFDGHGVEVASGTIALGRYIQVGPLTVEHWDL